MRAEWAVGIAERVVAGLLPASERDSVIGDLREEMRGSSGCRPWRTLALGLPIALCFHRELYADADRRLRVLTVAALGWAVIALIRWAAWPAMDLDVVYVDPISSAVSAMWNAAHLTGAAGAGLLAGHLPERIRSGSDGPARMHAVILVALGAALAAGGVRDAATAALVTLAAAWVGRRGREVSERPTSRPTRR